MDALWASVAVGAALLVVAATLHRLRAPRAGSASPWPPSPTGSATPKPASERPSSPHVVDATRLPAERRRAYVDAFGKLPRPPRLLQHLLSPRLFQLADSRELVDLIRAEPLIAARVLSAVNSAAHALPCRITSLEQAVNWLGLDAVRILGLRYAMRAAFPTDSNERLRRLDDLWAASGLAAEFAQRLSSAPGFRSRELLVSAVLLSFLGRIAVAAAAPRALLALLSQHDPLQRLQAEQEALGLTAGQIGRLLMLEWKLDAPLVDCTAALETLPLHRAATFDTDDGALLALGYLCVRLGERIVCGELRSLATFDPETEARPEWLHWREHLQHPALVAVVQRLHSGEFDELVERQTSSSGPN
jgi:HD-like signal output (HDOD) protein